MRERPILFSGPMVRALLPDAKTQTRRVVKGSDRFDALLPSEAYPEEWVPWIGGEPHHSLLCPYGVPSDQLWVRENFRLPMSRADHKPKDCAHVPVFFEADRADPQNWPSAPPWGKIHPAIHMPRWASRISLRVTGVRVERLQDISEADAMAEGVILEFYDNARDAYADLWEHINGPGSWDLNPWVWAVGFERVESKHDGATNQA